MTDTLDTRVRNAAAQIGGPEETLTDEQVRRFIREQLATVNLDGRSVCVLVPDGTRSCPLPLLLEAVHGALHERASQVTVLIALGTHAAMGEAELAAMIFFNIIIPILVLNYCYHLRYIIYIRVVFILILLFFS